MELGQAAVQQHDAVAQVQRFVDVVRDQQYGEAVFKGDLEQQVLQLHAREGVDGGEGLVEQQHARLGEQAARDGGALGLSAESCFGSACAWSCRPTSASRRVTSCLSSPLKATFSATVSHGNRRGSWKMKPMSLLVPCSVVPFNLISPLKSRSSPEAIDSRLLLPRAAGADQAYYFSRL
jgi:hypothetical protein